MISENNVKYYKYSNNNIYENKAYKLGFWNCRKGLLSSDSMSASHKFSEIQLFLQDQDLDGTRISGSTL